MDSDSGEQSDGDLSSGKPSAHQHFHGCSHSKPAATFLAEDHPTRVVSLSPHQQVGCMCEKFPLGPTFCLCRSPLMPGQRALSSGPLEPGEGRGGGGVSGGAGRGGAARSRQALTHVFISTSSGSFAPTLMCSHSVLLEMLSAINRARGAFNESGRRVSFRLGLQP